MALRRGEDRRPGRWGPRLASGCVASVLLLLATDAVATERSHQDLTRTAITASAYSVGEHYRTTHALPASLAPLRRRRARRDTTRDAWGRPLVYRKDAPDAFTITSMGADGISGGDGDDADVEVRYRMDAAGYEQAIGASLDRGSVP